MLTKNLTILRGLPGSGKSTYCRDKFPGLTPSRWAPPKWSPLSISGDHFFTSMSGEYNFDPTKIGEAHTAARCDLITAMVNEVEQIVVDNTHSRKWEYADTILLAKSFGYKIDVIDLFDGGCSDERLAERNTHGVPLEKITAMRERWEP